MLVLSRKRCEKILIGDDIVIEVCAFRGLESDRPSVRLGITAPRNVAVDRDETRKAKLEHRAASAKAASGECPGTQAI